MGQDKNTRIIEIDGQKFKVTSVFNENSDTDIINLIYDKFKNEEHDATLCLVNNPFPWRKWKIMHTELDISNRLVYSVCVILIGLTENDLTSKK